jgi:EAL domain-containing protein (putative c-di-GMP-specific phosphodiesterase class I)
LISPLTVRVLNDAIGQVRQWLDSGRAIEIAVNLSSKSLYDSELVDLVTETLRRWRVDPGYLRLELTETAIMEDPEAALTTLERIHEMGVNLSIDDFGTGYSSLGYLTRLPVDEIKIDREFVTDMRSKSQNAVIVRSTVELGHSLGLQVVAEGVEDRATWELLGLLGCDVGQGYFLGRPGPAADLTGKLLRTPRNRWTTERVGAAG